MIPLGLLLIALIGAVSVMIYFKSSARRIRESEPYQVATARALANAAVVKVLGAPAVVGKLAIGKVSARSDGSGAADFHFNVYGQWRSALVHVVAKREGGTWNYSEMYFLPNGGGDGIELAAQESSPSNPYSTAPVPVN